jgi:hypothetical protein
MKDDATEEVKKMGLRKHGIGEVLPDDEDLQKTADAVWTEEDQAALDEENSK